MIDTYVIKNLYMSVCAYENIIVFVEIFLITHELLSNYYRFLKSNFFSVHFVRYKYNII